MLLIEKKPFLAIKKFNISKSQKSHFCKGVNSGFWSKNAIFFFICFPSLKISVEIIFTDFVKKN